VSAPWSHPWDRMWPVNEPEFSIAFMLTGMVMSMGELTGMVMSAELTGMVMSGELTGMVISGDEYGPGAPYTVPWPRCWGTADGSVP
jgi:hypothetical protein